MDLHPLSRCKLAFLAFLASLAHVALLSPSIFGLGQSLTIHMPSDK